MKRNNSFRSDSYNPHKRSRSDNYNFNPYLNASYAQLPPYCFPPVPPQLFYPPPQIPTTSLYRHPPTVWSQNSHPVRQVPRTEPLHRPRPKQNLPQDSNVKNRESGEDSYPLVTKSIMEYVRTNGQSEQILQTKMNLRSNMERALKGLFPSCDLFLFGSSASGFGSKTSDMDMCLVTNLVQAKDVKALYKIKAVLSNQFNLKKLQVINAKVPILKFVHASTEIQCDLNINNSDGVRNTHLLKYFTRSDPRLVPLVLAIKRWARQHKINDASQGTFSSYALTLMAIHYLQCGVHPPVLPNLLAENAEIFHPRRRLQSLSFNDQVFGNFRSTNPKTVGELFVGFLTYYSRDFPYQYSGISLREARVVPKRTAKEFSKLVFIEEPYNLDNVARAVQKHNEPYIRRVIESSWNLITKMKQFEPILGFKVSGSEKIVSFNNFNKPVVVQAKKEERTTSQTKSEEESSPTQKDPTPAPLMAKDEKTRKIEELTLNPLSEKDVVVIEDETPVPLTGKEAGKIDDHTSSPLLVKEAGIIVDQTPIPLMGKEPGKIDDHTSSPLLEKEVMIIEDPAEKTEDAASGCGVSELYQLSLKSSFKVSLEIVGESGPAHAREFRVKCTVILRKAAMETLLVSTGGGTTKKMARNAAAKNMINILKERTMGLDIKETFP